MSEFAGNQRVQQASAVNILDQSYGPIKLEQLLQLEPEATTKRISDLISSGKITANEYLFKDLLNRSRILAADGNLNLSREYLEFVITLGELIPSIPSEAVHAAKLALSSILMATHKFQLAADTAASFIKDIDSQRLFSIDNQIVLSAYEICIQAYQELQDYEQVLYYTKLLKDFSICNHQVIGLVAACTYIAKTQDTIGNNQAAITEIVDTYFALTRVKGKRGDDTLTHAFFKLSELCDELRLFTESHMLAVEALKAYELAYITVPNIKCALLRRLSRSHQDLGQHQEAYENLLESFKIYKTLSGHNRETLDRYRNQLAEIKSDSGEYQESLRLKRLILSNVIKNGPQEVIRVVEARMNYAMGLMEGHSYLSAKEHVTLALDLLTSVMPKELADILNGDKTELEQSLPSFLNGLNKARREELMPIVQMYVSASGILAGIRMSLKGTEENFQQLVKNYEILNLVIPIQAKSHQARVKHALAVAYFSQDMYSEAIEYCDQALDDVVRGSNSEASIYITRASANLKFDKYDLAYTDILEAKNIFEKLPRYKHSIHYLDLLLCQSEYELSQYELYSNYNHLSAAQAYLDEAQMLCKKFGREDSLGAMRTFGMLARLAEYSDNTELAELYKNKAKTILANIDIENDFQISRRIDGVDGEDSDID